MKFITTKRNDRISLYQDYKYDVNKRGQAS